MVGQIRCLSLEHPIANIFGHNMAEEGAGLVKKGLLNSDSSYSQGPGARAFLWKVNTFQGWRTN